jgi:ribosomal protein S7
MRRIEHGRSLFKKKSLPIFHTLSSQLLVYSRSYAAVFFQIQQFLKQVKKTQSTSSPIAYLNLFLTKAVPRLFLRDYRAGKNRLKIPVPAKFSKRRASFLKQLLIDLRARPEPDFYSKLCSEIQDFNSQQGITYTKKLDTYIISKQHRNYSRYAYRGKGYVKKNVVKKNKLSFI